MGGVIYARERSEIKPECSTTPAAVWHPTLYYCFALCHKFNQHCEFCQEKHDILYRRCVRNPDTHRRKYFTSEEVADYLESLRAFHYYRQTGKYITDAMEKRVTEHREFNRRMGQPEWCPAVWLSNAMEVKLCTG